jgi:hypothetical protein
MKLLTTTIKRVLHYFEIVTLQPSLPILLRDKTPARMTLPTVFITDPKFVYKNSSCTDITQTFEKEKEKNERLQRLLNHADLNRAKDQSTGEQVPVKKLRRVHG